MKNHLLLSIYYNEEKRKGSLKFMHELQFSVLMPIAISLNILLLILKLVAYAFPTPSLRHGSAFSLEKKSNIIHDRK